MYPKNKNRFSNCKEVKILKYKILANVSWDEMAVNL
jgi:hypothetical protein